MLGNQYKQSKVPALTDLVVSEGKQVINKIFIRSDCRRYAE